MAGKIDGPLEDSELLAEIKLLGDVIIAATEADGVLALADIDRILRLSGQEPG